jgi:hypothetical protein
MANVVRLVNGGSIQVRTGVIQGIGPQGPMGVAGNQGADGPQGPVGDPGPMGQILQLMGRTSVATNNPVAANTDTVIAFGSVAYDDLSCFSSTSNVTLTSPGDYLLSVWVRFDDAAAGYRDIWFATGGTLIARGSRANTPGQPCYANLAQPYRAVGGEVVNVLVRAGQATAVSLGALNVTRVGSGPPGPAGPVGPQGPIGATGAQGPVGAPGTANAGFTKYGDLLPH